VLRALCRRARLVVLLSLIGAGAGCASAGSETARSPAPAANRPTCHPAPLSERAARVVVAGLPEVTQPSDPVVGELIRLRVGGVFITDSNVQSMAQVGELIATIKREAGRPLVISTDEESGRVSTFASVLGGGASPRRLAAQGSPADVRGTARDIGTRLRSLGINVDFAPVADVDAGPSSAIIGDRSFSGDPATASRYALAFAQGLNDAQVLPVAKHFPGQGRAGGDTHTSRSTVDTPLDQLRASDLVPFQDMIDAGVPVVMLSHAAYTALEPDVPASLSPRAYELLRELGFTGVAMTDAVGMGAVNTRWDYEPAAVKAIAAGADALLVTDGKQARRLRDALIAAVTMRELDEARLNEAATRVTVLAGGDPMALTCETATLPELSSTPTS
jgi:beta-N-acetylhexosaminidase